MGNGGHASTASHLINDLAKHTIVSDKKDKVIRTTFLGLFKDVLGRIVLDNKKPLEHFYLFNGTNTSYIHTHLKSAEGKYDLVVFDPFLEEVRGLKVQIVDGGLNLSLTVSEGGMLEVVRAV